MLENKFVEASFMVAEKWKLYTLILKVFYSNNKFEGVKFKAGKEATEKELYNYCKNLEEFSDIDLQQYKQLISQLVEWQNLDKRLDYDEFETWEDFHNNSMLYSITTDTIQLMEYIERKEHKKEEIRTLSTSYIDDIVKNLQILKKCDLKRDQEKIYNAWLSIREKYEEMYKRYRDYLHQFLDQTKEKIELADLIQQQNKLITIINDFIIHIGEKKRILIKIMLELEEFFYNDLLNVIAEKFAQKSISDYEKEREVAITVWSEIKEWFSDNKNSISVNIQEYTIKFVDKLYENINELLLSNRRKMDKEYFHILKLINSCNSEEELSKLCEYIFGINQIKHYRTYNEYSIGDNAESTFDIAGVDLVLYKTKENKPTNTKTRGRIEKSNEDKERERQKNLKDQEILSHLKEKFLKEKIDTLDYSNQVLKNEEFQYLFNLYYQGFINKENIVVTKFGKYYKVDICENEKINLICEDGICKMPRCFFTQIN